MLDLALILDLGRGAFLTRNHDLCAPTLVAHVEATYDPGSLSGNRAVTLTKAQRAKYARLLARWSPCPTCGWPMGVHYGNDDPALNHPHANDWFVKQLRALRTREPAPLREVVDIKAQGQLL